MKTQRIVILAGGAATRMKKAAPDLTDLDPTLANQADTLTKGMIGLGDSGKSLIDYQLENASNAGFNEVLMLLHPDDDFTQAYYEKLAQEGNSWGIQFVFARQYIHTDRVKPAGTADAVLQALEQHPDWQQGRIVVCNSDNLYSAEALHALRETESPNAFISYDRDAMDFPLERISRFAIAKLDANNQLLDILEKPSEDVLEQYKDFGLNIKGVDAKDKFLSQLAGVEDPETKRKIIGRVFIEVFDDESHLIEDVKWLAQGTIYPDVIESVSVKGPSATIKSHHNVGGLPDYMKLKIVEPLRMLFKDEVRRVGATLGIDPELLGRHPFPGPGLSIRILGDITPEKVQILQDVDAVFIDGLKSWGLYDKVWQAGAILLPVNSVGVMGDERTYEKVVALRAVESTDGMTADWVHLPYDFLMKVSNDIINKVKGVNRVVYDISSKPPATIEWE